MTDLIAPIEAALASDDGEQMQYQLRCRIGGEVVSELSGTTTDRLNCLAIGLLAGDLAGAISKLLALYREAQQEAERLRAELERVSVDAADRLNGLDTPTRVRFYEHDFYVLSNFSAFNLRWSGHNFPTSEHAYHWEKFTLGQRDLNSGVYIRDAILDAPSAHEAFKLAEAWRGYRRKDWDAVKVGIMRDILRRKAEQHEYVRRKLLATGDRELVEDSWRDDFWGWGPNRDGQNMLGRLWMEIRAELRNQGSPK